jgi:adenine phosphoribosyltransferase
MVNHDLHPLARHIRSVPDFPKKGIVFRDITTLLQNAVAYREAIDVLSGRYAGMKIDKLAAIESRGFILGAAMAEKLKAGFVPIRKGGKLPGKTLREEFALEYGKDAIEIHLDSIRSGENVLLHDDVLATGGTAQAACRLIEKLGGRIVGIAFLAELDFLKGRSRLSAYDVFSVVHYETE